MKTDQIYSEANTPSQVIANALKLIEDLKGQNQEAEQIIEKALLKIQENNSTIADLEINVSALNSLSNAMHILTIAQYSFGKRNKVN